MYVSHLLDFNMNDVVSFNIKYFFVTWDGKEEKGKVFGKKQLFLSKFNKINFF